MRGKWVNFYSTIAAGTVMTASITAAKKTAKKYGQKPNENKLVNINIFNTIDYAVKKFLEADNEKISDFIKVISSSKNSK